MQVFGIRFVFARYKRPAGGELIDTFNIFLGDDLEVHFFKRITLDDPRYFRLHKKYELMPDTLTATRAD